MNAQIKGVWSRLEDNKTQAEAMVKANYQKQVKEGWNPLQALEHLLQSEAGVLAYYKKKTQTPAIELPLSDDDTIARSTMLNNRLKSNERYNRPAIMPDPAGDKSVEEYLAYWNSIRGDWEAFLSDLPAEYYKRQVYKHPFAGRLTIVQTLEFLTNHLAHHFRQLKGA